MTPVSCPARWLNATVPADIHVHLAGAAANCSVVEYFDVHEDVYNFDLVLGEHLTVSDGWIDIPDRPGTGLVIDEKAVEHYRVT